MSIFGFTEVDLEANRQGRLSDAQRKRHNAEVDTLRHYGKNIALGLMAFFVIYVVLRTMIEPTDANVEPKATQFLSLVFFSLLKFLIALSCLSISFGSLFVFPWWMIHRYAQGHIRVIEGTAKIINMPDAAPTEQYKVIIKRDRFGKIIFRFREPESLAYFMSEKRYRVYYLHVYILGPKPLSCEEIPDEKAKR